MDDVVHCKVNKPAILLTKFYSVAPIVGKILKTWRRTLQQKHCAEFAVCTRTSRLKAVWGWKMRTSRSWLKPRAPKIVISLHAMSTSRRNDTLYLKWHHSKVRSHHLKVEKGTFFDQTYDLSTGQLQSSIATLSLISVWTSVVQSAAQNILSCRQWHSAPSICNHLQAKHCFPSELLSVLIDLSLSLCLFPLKSSPRSFLRSRTPRF